MNDNAPKCGRENDLIGFLYGELNDVEALAFQRHLRECAACEEALAGLGMVRDSVVAWRNESLGSIGFPAALHEFSFNRPPLARPSAAAALREFFNLSPLWMKSAVAGAAVLFCVLAAFSLVRLGATPPPALVKIPKAPSQAEINALVERRVQAELDRVKAREDQVVAPLTANDWSPRKAVKRIPSRANETVASKSLNPRRPLSKNEREQLAADLRLVPAKSESDLELLVDTINE